MSRARQKGRKKKDEDEEGKKDVLITVILDVRFFFLVFDQYQMRAKEFPGKECRERKLFLHLVENAFFKRVIQHGLHQQDN